MGQRDFRHDFNRWREEIGRRLIKLDFEPASDEPPKLVVKPLLEQPDLRAAVTSFSPGRSFRDNELSRGSEGFSFVVARTRLEAHCSSRSVRLSAGDACVVPLDEPASVLSGAGFTAIGMSISATALRQRGIVGTPQMCARLPDRGGALALLRGYLGTVERLASKSKLPALAQDHILDLISIACTSTAEIGESISDAATSARFEHARSVLEARFSDPDLELAEVASALRISPRYLQLVFERMGTSFTRTLTEIRLKHAEELLTQTPATRRAISAIASASGFSDLSHFYRVFKSRYGAAPGELRTMRASSVSKTPADPSKPARDKPRQ